VRALARAASAAALPAGVEVVVGNALDAESFAGSIAPADTLVHLVGTPHPNPRKAREFIDVDLRSLQQALIAARRALVAHLVYVSVAQPAPLMRDYLAARAAAERAVRDAAITATVLRPWYVVGPGHRWPLLLVPLYALAEVFPSTRETALRLGLVTLAQMVAALARAAENPPGPGVLRICAVPCIRDHAD
jgi:uncharacterized protein YbjT (DUF2867 family)